MVGAARELAERARALDARRTQTFGGGELGLAGAGSLHTEAPVVPRDLVQIGGLLLFGFAPASGAVTEVADVFALYRRGDGGIERAGLDAVPGLLDDPAFRRDFTDLHRYYRAARLLRLRRTGPYLLAVFQTGERLTDIRVLRWRIAADGTPAYLDDKGERDHTSAPAHDFTWTAATREDHVRGRHPHIRIDDAVYVSTVGGRLTVKTEDDTETGEGVHSEPVEDARQSLADAEVAHARIGPLLLLRVRPYNETAWRHLVCDTRTGQVRRVDGIGHGCRRLPQGQGIVFPGGYYPVAGTARTFDTDITGLAFDRTLAAPNGGSVLYAFHAPARGRSLLLPYDVIREEAAAPIAADGWALFDDGTLAVLRAPSADPARLHPLQLWATPYVSETQAAVPPAATGPLARIGDAELVRGISDCLSLARMAEDLTPTEAVFTAITTAATRVGDGYPWLTDPALGSLAEPADTLRATAAQVIEEFRRVTALRRQAADALAEAGARVTALVRRIRGEQPDDAEGWADRLAELRQEQGRLETLREIRYLDLARLEALTAELAEDLAAAGRRAAAFLSGEDAFAGIGQAVAALADEAARITTVAQAAPVGERISGHADRLRAVTEVIASLELTDATVRTQVLARAGEVLGAVNRARATLDARRRALREAEDRAEFAAELALLGQSVAGALAAAATPEECDEQLGRLLLQVESLEARFGATEARRERTAAQREEIHAAFSARKQQQLDTRARHARRIADSAQRVMAAVSRRAAALSSPEASATYFASDPLVAKVRAAAAELRDLGETGRADELDGRLKAARQEADRALRDRSELYDTDGTVRLGRHRFAVNTQPLELALVPHDGTLAFTITGTDYRAPVTDPALAAHRALWDQPLVSESPEVYRAEHLAASLLARAEAGEPGPTPDALTGADQAELLGEVRRAAESRYDEGYDRGVHDHDAAAILSALLRLRSDAGLLRYLPEVRAAAQIFWAHGPDDRARTRWSLRARSLGRARGTFGPVPAIEDLVGELADRAADFLHAAVPDLPAPGEDRRDIGAYLFEELAAAEVPRFATSGPARRLLAGFRAALGGEHAAAVKELAEELRALDDLGGRHQLLHAWLSGHVRAAPAADAPYSALDLPEALAIELCGEAIERRGVDRPLTTRVGGLLGTHPLISEDGSLDLRLDEILARTARFRRHRVPAHRACTRRREELLAAERARLDLDAHRPQVMSAFVRNLLVDEVYLPLVGDNLARQMGAAGEGRRTDNQGLLLLLSPPGYGKTTLMEYVAARLGLFFVRVDGPALGPRTVSLDPAAAPDAAARREVEKINLALAMGGNVLLHLDDIQHTAPELLQKFIPLCDAGRRMEGVRDGQARTYDLRGKRFAVCMAGNPYTESGRLFRIPDMLANRADVWNLGDVLNGKEDLFALSHIENALTANPVLAPLAARDRADIPLLVRMARGEDSVRADRLGHPYSPAELEQVLSVLSTLLHVQETVLAVNRAYIASATQDDSSRTEPPFRLQGSYRNTNRLAERILPMMNTAEVEALIDDHYLGEAQTLTRDAEANLLKLAELRGTLGPEQARRWHEVKASLTHN
ncbi:DNA repair ATPase [Streptomyces palmae]|uniref:AAA family ATPase n=1 Tax=Streptomyces palmae TaxID=1701085 RepID=A0A4Z0HFQ7_9ACTN|nr:DNA repair ATPase [Streptomyces palmae]TGB19162.1 AAA family ATPase [Streptomyces palmae]